MWCEHFAHHIAQTFSQTNSWSPRYVLGLRGGQGLHIGVSFGCVFFDIFSMLVGFFLFAQKFSPLLGGLRCFFFVLAPALLQFLQSLLVFFLVGFTFELLV